MAERTLRGARLGGQSFEDERGIEFAARQQVGYRCKQDHEFEKPARTHWDMLLERRSEKELEEILKERLELLRGGEIGPAHLHRANRKKGKASA